MQNVRFNHWNKGGVYNLRESATQLRVAESPGESPRAQGSRREPMRAAESTRESPRSHESLQEHTRVAENP